MNNKQEPRTNNELDQEEKTIKTISIKPKISLSQEFSQYNGENLTKEFSWDEPQGKEIL